jgi:site-specific recombinase XerD
VGRTFKVGVKTSTVASHRSKLNSFFNWLLIKGLITANPFTNIPYPRFIYTNIEHLKKEELEKIITAIIMNRSTGLYNTKRNLAIIYLGAYCGLRRNEILSLKIPDLDMEEKSIYIRAETSKSLTSRKVYFGQEVKKILRDYLRERQLKNYTTPFLIASSGVDDHLTKGGMEHLVKKIKIMSGIRNFHIHRLRHTFAINMLSNGCDVATLSKIIGHTDIHQTMAYLRYIPSQIQRSSAERMALENFI